MDSGVNALSVCSRLVTLSDFMLTQQEEKTDGATVYHGERSYRGGDCVIQIRTGWDMGCDRKTTLIEFSDSDGKLLLHHSDQCAMWMQGEQKDILYQYDELPRLIAHYVGVFSDFYQVYSDYGSNQDQSIQIHRLLFAK